MQENDILNEENINNIKNIRIWDTPTLDEKIDYIYKYLKVQKEIILLNEYLNYYLLFLL